MTDTAYRVRVDQTITLASPAYSVTVPAGRYEVQLVTLEDTVTGETAIGAAVLVRANDWSGPQVYIPAQLVPNFETSANVVRERTWFARGRD